MKQTALGIAIVLLGMYLATAFVLADWGWLRGMFSDWSKGERVFFAYCVIVALFLGWMISWRREDA